MEPRLVAALFRSHGLAEDARNRLKTEGVPGQEIAIRVLRQIAPLLPTAEAELDALSIDPLVWDNVRQTFANFIRNGETAVLVRAENEAQAEFAAETLRQYAPIAIDIISLSASRGSGEPFTVGAAEWDGRSSLAPERDPAKRA